jgi:hypothetical protein
MAKDGLLSMIISLGCMCNLVASEITIVPTGGDDAALIQHSLDELQTGDTLLLLGDFIIANTLYLPSDFTWNLKGSLTLSGDADLDKAGWVDAEIDARRLTGITEKQGGATNIDMSGGTYYGNAANYPNSMRFINFVSVTHSRFHDMLVTEVTDDNFTLGPGCNNNECRNLTGSFAGGNALTDKGDHNTWIDCIASECASDGWTPKCRYSTFIRCIASNNVGPGFGMYARKEGYAGNKDVGAYIIGNRFIDCVSYGSLESSGFSFNISSNCPGAVIMDNYIQAVCYDNQGSGVFFRNKDDAELGIVKDNMVDIVCYGNKGLRKSGDLSSWAGGLGMEDDNSSVHNIIENITGSVVCYDNRIDVNTRGGHDCKIKVYHPEGENDPVLDDKSSGNNSVTVIGFSCSDSLESWCQYKYCNAPMPPLPEAPSDLIAEVISSSRIDLSWTDDAAYEEGFIIEQKTADTYVPIATVDADVTFFVVTGLTELTTYAYRVRAFNVSGYSGYSPEIFATTPADSTTTVRGHETGADLEPGNFPNPFRETTQIAYLIRGECFVSLKVFDQSGRLVGSLVHETQRAGRYTTTFDGKGLPGGAYYYRLKAGNLTYTKKMILVR